MDKLLLIDANNLCYAGMVIGPMTNPKGERVDIPFITLKILSKIVRNHRPDQIVAVWDGGRSKHRLTVFPEYKATHTTATSPDEPKFQVYHQRELVKEIFSLLGIVNLEYDGYEADDLLYRSWLAWSRECLILSTDSDFQQLLDQRTWIIDRKNDRLFSAADFFEKWGFPSDLFAHHKSLTGDGSDDIPGIHLVGEGTATKLCHYAYENHRDNLILGIREAAIKVPRAGRVAEADNWIIFKRNLRLILLSLEPMESEVETALRDLVWTKLPYREEEVIKYLQRHGMVSLVENYHRWIKPFDPSSNFHDSDLLDSIPPGVV